MSDLSATNCGSVSGFEGGNCCFLILILLLCGGCGNGCGNNGVFGGSDNSCLIIILLLFFCGGCGNSIC